MFDGYLVHCTIAGHMMARGCGVEGMISLSGKKALVVGIANEQSIAYGCAQAFRDQGAGVSTDSLNQNLLCMPLYSRAWPRPNRS